MDEMGVMGIILLILFCAIIIIPFVILSKINSLGKEIRSMNEQIKALMISGIQKPPSVPKEVVEPVQNIEVSRKEEISEAPVVYKIPAIPAKKDVSIATVHSVSPPKKQECTYLDTSTLPEKQDTSTVPPPVDKDRDERNVIEKLLGTNWLSKVGIVTFVLGIGFFVKYAIDQDWINEIGRVGIGLLTGGIIIGIAHKLKTKYHVFSSILVGGGISVFYITITLAFHEYELFSQTTAFVLLILTTVFSVLLSLFYDRKELAVFSLLGGFASPLMVSTGVGNYVVLFSYIFILNTGMLIVAYRKKWRIIGMISFILTLLFFWTWTLESYKDQFFNVSLFISLFYIQFYLLALLDHYKSVKKISAYQAFLILINNCSTFLAFIYVFDNYTYDVRGGITMALAVINAVILVILFRNNRIDRNMNYLIIAIVLSFVSLAIPIQLKGHVITLFWAAESVILLWLWQKSRINIFYNGFLLISLLMLVSYIMDVNHLYVFPNTMPFIANRLFITGVVIIAAFVINRLLLKRESPEYGNHKHIAGLFNVMIILLAYIVPLLEIDLQIYRFANPGLYVWPSLRFITLATFTTIYIAVLGIIYHRKISTKKYIFILLYLTVLLYAIYYTLLVMDFRYVIFRSLTEYNLAGYFFIHLLSLPAIAYIVYLVIRHIKSLPSKQSNWLSWLLTVLVVVILSVEVDNIVIWLFGNANNYDAVLYDVHTFGYPILWGVIAMILMIWGLNRKERLLRKISLVFFAFIIVKFYAYDVWKMSQSGRIISFVLLGVILLLVSFLQQKIRTLVKNDKETEVEHNELSE